MNTLNTYLHQLSLQQKSQPQAESERYYEQLKRDPRYFEHLRKDPRFYYSAAINRQNSSIANNWDHDSSAADAAVGNNHTEEVRGDESPKGLTGYELWKFYSQQSDSSIDDGDDGEDDDENKKAFRSVEDYSYYNQCIWNENETKDSSDSSSEFSSFSDLGSPSPKIPKLETEENEDEDEEELEEYEDEDDYDEQDMICSPSDVKIEREETPLHFDFFQNAENECDEPITVIQELDQAPSVKEEIKVEVETISENTVNSTIPEQPADVKAAEASTDAALPPDRPWNRRRWFRRNRRDGNEEPFEEKEKTVMEELWHNHFDVLPEGWLQISHNSGMSAYLHKPSRVCTFSKPYFLGNANEVKHEIPLSNIPCLQYLRAIEEEREAIRKFASTKDPVDGENESDFPIASVETAKENKAKQSLPAEQVREYCERLFKFEMVPFRCRNKVTEAKETKKKKKRKKDSEQRPTLPEGTKLIKFPEGYGDFPSLNSRHKKEKIMNPNGKSYICILHEYIQHALKKQPGYEYSETGDPNNPHTATVVINDIRYGCGFGPSKKVAKLEAAKRTLAILIPDMKDKIDGGLSNNSAVVINYEGTDLSFFDQMSIEDPRISEISHKTTQPSPYSILVICLQRNFGIGKTNISCSVNVIRQQKTEFTMKVGVHTATVVSRNKREAKQRAAQSILKQLHPHVTNWGSLLRMYGINSVETVKEKKQKEKEITSLQVKSSVNSPNFAILEKLFIEMEKIKESQETKGKFIPPPDEDLPTLTSTDDLNLFKWTSDDNDKNAEQISNADDVSKTEDDSHRGDGSNRGEGSNKEDGLIGQEGSNRQDGSIREDLSNREDESNKVDISNIEEVSNREDVSN